MTDRRNWLLPAVIGLELLILALDSFTPLGVADGIFYVLPVVLTFLGTRPWAPLVAAGFATVLLVAGAALSPEGAAGGLVLINRAFSLVVVWVAALLVRSIVATREQLRRQGWLKSAQTDLALRIRGDLNEQQLGARSLAFLAELLNAQVGAFFVRDEAGDLERVAGYALADDDVAPRRLRLGEGLVGQAAAEARLMVVDELPPGYLRVSSGLGTGAPARLLLLPLITADEVAGVLELGFLGPPSAQADLLLTHSGELLATAVRSAQYRRRLSGLLAESQQQAEELQVQQEEMAALNEELEQQNRALKESQSRLENQQAELEQNNQQLEEQAESLQRQKALLDERNKALVEAQARLQQKRRELERASRYKSEFLANMSHELRTPLNSTLILARLLADNRDGNLSAEQIKYAETIYSAGNDLLNLINDVLDLSKVEAGKLDVELEPFDLSGLLTSLERTFQPLARDKRLNFQVVVDPSVPTQVFTDRRRLEQILNNFLSNALKFTDRGGVTLRVGAENGEVRFAVQDTGIGIAEDQQDLVFEAFQQADGTDNRRHGGTGLGLSISRELAGLPGGEIRVDSAPGQGSTFTLSLPLKTSVTAEAEAVAAPEPAPVMDHPEEPRRFTFTDDRARLEEGARRVLVIEDDEAFARILFDLGHEMGYQVLVAATAAEGLGLARGHRPAAILLDIRLPDHNGLALLEQLKADPATRHIPVHIVSGEDFSLTARRLGAVGYMLKPVKREALVHAFEGLRARMDQHLKRVLVVEDDATQREAIVQLIRGEDIGIEAVSTAAEALAALAAETFDCMIMDLNLPDRSGYDLLGELSKADSPYSYPPVIVYTGRDVSRAEEERLRRYSNSIIIKGARSPERLLSEVTLFLHRVETELPPERQKMLKELRSRERALDGARILVADDDARNIFALSSALEPHGAELIIARNGREALERLSEAPDLVLMDIMMPEMNGLDAIRAIREQPEQRKLPIIALTAKAMRDDQEQCLRAGANDYLAKPVDLDKLLSLLRVWLSARKGF